MKPRTFANLTKKFKSAYFLYPPGRATWTKHYRNGVELPEIARDDNYDFNFQVH